MHVLFVMRHAGFVRNFEPLLRELDARGHHTHVILETLDAKWDHGRAALDEIRRSAPLVESSAGLSRSKVLGLLARAIRHQLDYVRFLEPGYESAPKLRARAARRVPPPIRAALARPGLRPQLRRLFERLERSIPVERGLVDLLRSRRPDVVAITPLIELGSQQVDWVRAARSLAIPTVLLVASWDNLSNKGHLREVPDRVVVWNDAQAKEAVELQGIDTDAVVTVGAYPYDQWFEWEPGRARADHCEMAGIRADAPYVLYVCSSRFVAPDEVGFVTRWLEGIRTAPDLNDLGVIVRPHPQNAEQWAGIDLSRFGNAVVWPAGGTDPVAAPQRADYFDSIHYAAAVVGVNTSALVESAIIGTPGLTVLDDDFRATQEGTLHFRMLVGPDRALHVAATLDEHIAELSRLVTKGGAGPSPARFVSWFVRPHGLDRPSAPFAADALEEAARVVVAPGEMRRGEAS